MNLMNDATSVGWNPALLGLVTRTDAVLVIPYDRSFQSTRMIGGFISSDGVSVGFTSGRDSTIDQPSEPFSFYGGMGVKIPKYTGWIGASFRYSEFGGRTVRYMGSLMYNPIPKFYLSLGMTNMYSVDTKNHVYSLTSSYSPLDWITLHGRLQFCPDSAILYNKSYASELGISTSFNNKQIVASFSTIPEARQARFGLEIAFDVLSIGSLNEASTVNSPDRRFSGGNVLLRINHDSLWSVNHYREPAPPIPACKIDKSCCEMNIQDIHHCIKNPCENCPKLKSSCLAGRPSCCKSVKHCQHCTCLCCPGCANCSGCSGSPSQIIINNGSGSGNGNGSGGSGGVESSSGKPKPAPAPVEPKEEPADTEKTEPAPIPEEPSEPPFPEVTDVQSSSKLFSLKSVFFDSAKWDLRPESTEELTRLYEYLEENPDLSIQINAHTDNVGSNKANQILSQKRAQSVVEFLIEMGIDSSRLEAKGFGEEYPIAPNDSDEGRQENRRVEFMTKNI
jgi:outer membrane protein OmpA-like peptidoglycan-associated protein